MVPWYINTKSKRERAVTTRIHVERSFEFVAEGSMETVAPLFGADRERVWAEDWHPEFVWPQPAADREGMVFLLDHDGRTAVWVNTVFDLTGGLFQYIYVIPECLVTRITIRLTPQGAATHVHVTYARTALAAAANDQVETMAARDASAATEWSQSINGWFSRAGVSE